MKKLIKSALYSIGIEARRAPPESYYSPGGVCHPIARIGSFLKDIKARNFSPRGLIDVGANRRDWTRHALSIFPSTPVILMEPQEETEFAISHLASEMVQFFS